MGAEVFSGRAHIWPLYKFSHCNTCNFVCLLLFNNVFLCEFQVLSTLAKTSIRGIEGGFDTSGKTKWLKILIHNYHLSIGFTFSLWQFDVFIIWIWNYDIYRIWNEFSFHTVFMKRVVCFISPSLWRGHIKHTTSFINTVDSFYHMIIPKNINISWKKYVFWENSARKSPWNVVLYATS